MEFEVANRGNNRLVGDQQPADVRVRTVQFASGLLGGKAYPAGRYTFETRSARAGAFKPVAPLLPSGLLGPVTVRAVMNAVGYFELYVNGRKVSADVLSPSVSDLKAHTLYVTYDLAPYLKAGTNCIGLWSGRGWATRAEPPGQRVQFQCCVPAGTGGAPVWIVSDESWKVAPSPYTMLGSQAWGKFGGERYDANLESPRWCAADFDDSAWANARPAPATPARAGAQSCPPNRVGKVLPAVAVTPLAEGRYEIDFGTNLSGWLRLKFRDLKPGQTVRMLAEGATTFWEQWNGYYSHIHSCFTSPGDWFFESLAGIQTDPAAPGFKRSLIKPALVGDVTWVKAHHDSIHGRIVSNWRRAGDQLTMDVTIPANTTATVLVPAKTAASVTESGEAAAEAPGVKFLSCNSGVAAYEVGGGHYRFQSAIEPSTVGKTRTTKEP